ncbi:MAG: hypothetical protein LBN04_10350 [Oscillospiraceae bacterium]|nr:hypothetical protein [Oscillospiraceae bacterium]
MKRLNHETWELLGLSCLAAIATAIALAIDHPRALFMLGLTIVMVMMLFVSRYRHRPTVRALKGRGRRKS